MPDVTAIQRDLQTIEADLKRLETDYQLYFTNRKPRPPLELRQRVERMIRRYDNARIPSSTERFRFSTLQSRFSTFTDLWDRAMRAREEGRKGPFA